MATKSSSSDVSAPDYNPEPTSNQDLIRGFLLALGAEGVSGSSSTFTRKASLPSPTSPRVSRFPAWLP